MIKPKRGSKNRSSSEMIVPFSLDDTFEIIESVQAQKRIGRRFTIHAEHIGDATIKFRVSLKISDILGIGYFDCFGELNGDGAYNITTLQWLPAKRLRSSDMVRSILFFVWVTVLATASPNILSSFSVIFFVFGYLSTLFYMLFSMIHLRSRINYIRKKVETRLFEAMSTYAE